MSAPSSTLPSTEQQHPASGELAAAHASGLDSSIEHQAAAPADERAANDGAASEAEGDDDGDGDDDDDDEDDDEDDAFSSSTGTCTEDDEAEAEEADEGEEADAAFLSKMSNLFKHADALSSAVRVRDAMAVCRSDKDLPHSSEGVDAELARRAAEDNALQARLRDIKMAAMPKFVFGDANNAAGTKVEEAAASAAAAAGAGITSTAGALPAPSFAFGAGLQPAAAGPGVASSLAFAIAAPAAAAPAAPAAPFAFKLGGSFGSASASARPARKSAGSSGARPAASTAVAAHRPRHRLSHEAHAAAAPPVSFGLPSVPAVFEFGSSAAPVLSEESVRAPSRVHLYRNALECVFQFLSLSELGGVLAVSKEWAGAVERMKCAQAPFEPRQHVAPDVSGLCGSRVARHVGRIGSSFPRVVVLTPPQLAEVSARCSSLRALHAFIELDSSYAANELQLLQFAADKDLQLQFQLPKTLRTLQVDIGVRFELQNRCHEWRAELLRAVVLQLPELETLVLSRVFAGVTSLTSLQQLPNLRTLELWLTGPVQLSEELVADLRQLPQLHRLRLLGMSDSALVEEDVELLLADPAPQWRDIGPMHLTDHTAAQLVRMPSLTKLHGLVAELSSCQFLCKLPLLESLDLLLHEEAEDEERTSLRESLEAAAVGGGMASLTHLHLCGDFLTPPALRAVLQRTPLLRDLTLVDCARVTSFGEGVLGGVCATLQRLSLINTKEPPKRQEEKDSSDEEEEEGRVWQLEPAEMAHIVQCQQLRSLTLSRVLPLDAFARHPFEQRPCGPLPQLEQLHYVPPANCVAKTKIVDPRFALLNKSFKRQTQTGKRR